MALIFKAMLAQNETRGAIMKLDGRIAVVSGAFRGIGKASAEILATEGAHVIALDIIDGEPVYASPRIAYRRFDVASPQMWDDLAKELERIDILVNSAGITQTRSGLTDLDLSGVESDHRGQSNRHPARHAHGCLAHAPQRRLLDCEPRPIA
jgi:NAD(P)-dependent dehydrogenase (short-subunit alcohol dehydrogenase family)